MRKTSNCLFCNTSFIFDDKNQFGKYCNNKCQQEHLYVRDTRPKIELGQVSNRPTLKKYIIRESGNICSICACSSTWQGNPLPFILDHINGDSDNNFPSNIRLVCPNCNSQLDTTKSRNRKNCKRNLYLREYKNVNKFRN